MRLIRPSPNFIRETTYTANKTSDLLTAQTCSLLRPACCSATSPSTSLCPPKEDKGWIFHLSWSPQHRSYSIIKYNFLLVLRITASMERMRSCFNQFLFLSTHPIHVVRYQLRYYPKVKAAWQSQPEAGEIPLDGPEHYEQTPEYLSRGDT